MLSKRKFVLLISAVMLLALVLVACQPAAPETVTEVVEVTRVVTETVVQEGETVEVTRVVTEVEEVAVEVTAVPEEAAGVAMVAADPSIYVEMTFGDPDTLDPALSYDTASSNIIDNVMEGLIAFDHKDGTAYVPALALEVPTLENGGISEDGMTYTFNIRDGVTYHNGNDFSASDAAYSYQRAMLQSDPNGPQWLLIEPIMGYASGDITEEIAEGAYYGDPDGLKENATPEELAAVCEKVKAAIVADDDAGTLTFNMAQPWGPFLATMGGTWGRIVDQEWAIENGAWDGDCATWQDWYAPGSENNQLTSIINGTGAYAMDHWTPGEEVVLTANENYWRTEDTPRWEGGPYGAPAIKTVIIKNVEEWGTRFASLQAGDAAAVAINPQDEPQVDPLVGEMCDWETDECTPTDNPDGPLRKWSGLPSTSRTDAFLVFDINPDSPYIGSGQLDGNGINPEFFSDKDVRLAMNYCFDYQTYIDEVQLGQGVRNNGPIIQGMLGYNPDGEMFEYDPVKCEEHLAKAWGGILPETGFRMQVAFNTGNTTRQTIGQIFQSELAAINPLYQVEVVGIPWPTFLRSFRASMVPVLVSGWAEDIHDPHNWAQPFTVGTYAGRQNMPEEMKAKFQELVTAGVMAADPAEREAIYYELQEVHHEEVPQVTLTQREGNRYENRWVENWYNRPGAFARDYYAYTLDGG